MLEFNGTTIVIAISFVLFVILENLIFYHPMKKTLDERAAYIAANENKADKDMSSAKVLLDDKNQKIADAKSESSKIINETTLAAQEKFNSAVEDAKANANNKIEEIKENLKAEKLNAENSLRSEVGAYAATIISKVLKKDVAVVNVNNDIIDKALRGEL